MSIPPSSPPPVDLVIIGGGINGTGIAADAAGRGLSVALYEQGDLGQYTSSASSKLIHGGLRYLEQYEFALVRKALAEREVLLDCAAHLVRPLRFILPHQPHLRPAWLIQIGLFLYDHLGARQRLAASKRVRLCGESPLRPEFHQGFEYSDCWVDDARLVIANAQAARQKGAQIETRTRCISATRHGALWRIQLQKADGQWQYCHARALINAAGPWAVQVLEQCVQQKTPQNLRLVQGSHLILPRLYEGDQAYILQNEDRRIVFVIPYLQDFTLVGTTDCEYQGDPAQARITAAEQLYLLETVRRYFRKPISATDIRHHFSGVRPLFDDNTLNPAGVTRDYRLVLSHTPKEAPLLSVLGGKLTTYRLLAKEAVDHLRPFFPQMPESQTAHTPLPGSERHPDLNHWVQTYPWVEKNLLQRWLAQYGSRIEQLLQGVHCLEDLGLHLGQNLYTREVDYLCTQEWAQTSEDILWRRTKLELFLNNETKAALRAYLAA